MKRAVRVDRCVWLFVGLCMGTIGIVRAADAPAPAASQAAPPAANERLPALRLDLPHAMHDARAAGTPEVTRSKSFTDLGVSVVELPVEGPPGPRSRPHHALSIATDAPRTMLRSIGIDATECATRFRLPTKVQRDTYGNSRVEMRAQLGLACGF